MTTFATNGDQGSSCQTPWYIFVQHDCLLTGKLQNRMSPKEAKRRGNICIDHAKTLQTNRKSYTKKPPVSDL